MYRKICANLCTNENSTKHFVQIIADDFIWNESKLFPFACLLTYFDDVLRMKGGALGMFIDKLFKSYFVSGMFLSVHAFSIALKVETKVWWQFYFPISLAQIVDLLVMGY